MGWNPVKAVKKAVRSVKKIVKNPGRAVAAVGTFGASEQLNAAENAVYGLIPEIELPTIPEAPVEDVDRPESDPEGLALAEARRRALLAAKKRGRSALRIDLAPGVSGAGVFIPS